MTQTRRSAMSLKRPPAAGAPSKVIVTSGGIRPVPQGGPPKEVATADYLAQKSDAMKAALLDPRQDAQFLDGLTGVVEVVAARAGADPMLVMEDAFPNGEKVPDAWGELLRCRDVVAAASADPLAGVDMDAVQQDLRQLHFVLALLQVFGTGVRQLTALQHYLENRLGATAVEVFFKHRTIFETHAALLGNVPALHDLAVGAANAAVDTRNKNARLTEKVKKAVEAQAHDAQGAKGDVKATPPVVAPRPPSSV